MSGPENPFAFPAPDDDRPSDGYGMTLRDYFAGQALAGYFANPHTPHMNATDAGAYCYAVADDLLRARALASEKGDAK